MSSKNDSLAGAKKSKKPELEVTTSKKVHASTSIPQGQSMASKTMAGNAASMRKPSSASMVPVSMPPISKSMAPKTMRGSQMHRDGTSTQRPVEHRGTTLNRDDVSLGTKLNRDGVTLGTNLNRDDVSLGTNLNRDDIPQGTMLFRDAATMKPVTMAPPGTKSIFLNPRDIAMASRQTIIDELPPDQRDKQEEWAQELIKRSGACPQGYDWNRRDGGYQCRGGGHGITDEMLTEGRGGMWALPTKDWEVKDGPYYPRDGQWFRVKPGASGN